MEYSAIIDKTIKKELAEAYKKFPVVRKYLWELGCDKLTAEDLFQEACLIYVRKRQDKNFQLTSDPILYIYKKEFNSELDWLNIELEKQVRETKYKNMIKFSENLYPIVYPCGKYGGHEFEPVESDTTQVQNQIDI